MALTEKQKAAIKNMNKALKQLKNAKIKICGMDNDLLYATENMILKLPERKEIGGEYCNVARACQSNISEETGKFDTSGIYEDSGGW